ncbi:MAG: glycosyl transferase [Candidatus Sumerlaea sp.]|jgi:GT2 family glycosyltransferase|nr:MAG: glycosyl transferase [Candidatus Sumerlaea sp.]
MSKFAVLFPVGKVTDLTRRTLEALKPQTERDWKCYLLEGASDAGAAKTLAAELADDRFVVGPTGLTTLAKMMNWAMRESGATYIMPLPEGVLLKPQALERFASYLDQHPQAAVAYSCYAEVKPDGKEEKVQLYPHEGCIHERFDFGYIKVYRADKLREIGGFREDLVHAAEYDVELKLGDNYTLELVDEVLYSVVVPEQAESAPGALHSPGKGKFGGFSYVFYPPDLEQEVTSVFEEMLKRRGAYIDHETEYVPYPKEPYPVMASVVIPVLNRAKYIGNAIERCLEQTFKDFEVIVVDNGSTDGTVEIVQEYAKKDPRVRLIRGTGNCIASALNDGIRAARGKYICQLDSDDEYVPTTLEKMIAHLESHPKCGLAISYYTLMDENRNPIPGIEPVTHKGYTRNQILRRDGAGALRVFPKVVLEEMGLYDEENYGNFGEDYDMVLKVGEKYDVDRVHEVLYRYRRHSDNTDVTRDPWMKIRNKNHARLQALKRRQEINRKLGKWPPKQAPSEQKQ